MSDYYEKGEQYEVHVRSVANARNRLNELKLVTVPSSKGGKVPLGDIVRFDPGPAGRDQSLRPHPPGDDQRESRSGGPRSKLSRMNWRNRSPG